MVTKEQATNERMFHFEFGKSCQNWRRNGQTKLWKTRPDEFRTPVKYGLYDYFYIDQHNAHQFHVESECPNA